MSDEGTDKSPNWTMRLTVISTIAAVLAIVTPFLPSPFEKSVIDEVKSELKELPSKEQIQKDLKELAPKVGSFPPKPPLPLPFEDLPTKEQIKDDLKEKASKLDLPGPKPPFPPFNKSKK